MAIGSPTRRHHPLRPALNVSAPLAQLPALLAIALMGGCSLRTLFETRVLPSANPPGVELGLYGATPGGATGAGVASGDLDGDGKAELVVLQRNEPHGESQSLVTIWRGPWRGVHDLEQEGAVFIVPPPLGTFDGILVDDLTGDGIDDLGVWDCEGPTLDGILYILTGPLRNGTFDAARNAAGRVQGVCGATAIGDADGDGIGDLVVGNGEDLVLVWGPVLGRIDAGGLPDRVVGLGHPEQLTVAQGDLNGDGRNDLAVGIPELDRVALFYRPRGALSLADADVVISAATADASGASLLIDTVDEDASPDLLIGAPAARGGKGEVRFHPGPLRDNVPTIVFAGPNSARIGARIIDTVDHDGDGIRDLAVLTDTPYDLVVDGDVWDYDGIESPWFLLELDGQGLVDLQFTVTPAYQVPDDDLLGQFGAATSADFDGDGLQDLAVGAIGAMTTGAVYVWLANSR